MNKNKNRIEIEDQSPEPFMVKVKRVAKKAGVTAVAGGALITGFGEVVDQAAVDAEGVNVVQADNLTEAILDNVDIAEGTHFDELRTIVSQQNKGADGTYVVPKLAQSGDEFLRPFDGSSWDMETDQPGDDK